jgi:hypothetical protein
LVLKPDLRLPEVARVEDARVAAQGPAGTEVTWVVAQKSAGTELVVRVSR